MNIQFFCPMWGLAQMSIGDMLHKISAAGYDGIEFGLPLDSPLKDEFIQKKDELSLGIIAQQYGATGATFLDYKKDFIAHLRYLASFNPLFINSHTGKDYYSLKQNSILIQEAYAIERDTGIPIIHETHRGRFPFCINSALQYIEAFPNIKFVADFSHFCTVSESYLQDQAEGLKAIIKKSAHIHARVGHTQGPQVTDPRFTEWADALSYHLKWWDSIINYKIANGEQTFTITPEFGPEPYMMLIPQTNTPIANQWDINLYMMNMLRSRYANKLITL